jgi:hypothetical protein
MAAKGVSDQMVDAPGVAELPVLAELLEASLGLGTTEFLVHERR